MPDAERAAYNREKLAGASRDADAWLDDQVQKLQGLTDVHQFHKQWDFIIKRGRRAANAGRFFRDEQGKGPLTVGAELEQRGPATLWRRQLGIRLATDGELLEPAPNIDRGLAA